MKTTLLLAVVFALAVSMETFAQAPPASVTSVVYSNIVSTSRLDGCDPTYPCIDNRSQYARQSSYYSYRAFGTATWSVDMQWADVTAPGVWTSFGASAQVTNSGPASGIGFGVGPGSLTKPYHDYVRFVISATATIQNYFGTKQAWWTNTAGSVAFPITANQGGTGINFPVFFYPQIYGAVGDGTTNDTAAIQAATNAAAAAGGVVYFPATSGGYAVCSVQITTTAQVSWMGAGRHSSTVKRHSSCLQASTPLLKVTNASNLMVRDLGFNQLGNGSNYTNAASTVFASNVSAATIDSTYSTLGQSNAWLFDGGTNIFFTNNEMDHIWNAGFAIAGRGTASSPIWATGITANNNQCTEMPECIQVSIFAKDVTIVGNKAYNSAISLVQAVYDSTITGNTVRGSATYGNPVGPFDCIFLEGVEDFEVSGNWVSGCTKNGIFAQGSEVSVGTTMQLPIRRGKITGNHVDGASGAGIQSLGTSFDHSLKGGDWSVTGNTVNNADVGIAVSSEGFTVSDNVISNIFTDGIVVSVSKEAHIDNNKIYNVGLLSVNAWYGINIGDGPTTDILNLYINNNEIVDTLGNMRGGVVDGPLQAGHAVSTRHCGNIISGYVAGAWFPTPALPTLGTFTTGDCVENFTTGFNQPLGWKATAGGTPGTWAVTGFSTDTDCISSSTPEHCGNSSAGIGVMAPGTVQILVESSAVTASNQIVIQEDDSLSAPLGVTCNGTSNPAHVVNRVAGAYFTVGMNSAPVTNPKCFSWRIKQQ